jgi:hypothetical protein
MERLPTCILKAAGFCGSAVPAARGARERTRPRSQEAPRPQLTLAAWHRRRYVCNKTQIGQFLTCSFMRTADECKFKKGCNIDDLSMPPPGSQVACVPDLWMSMPVYKRQAFMSLVGGAGQLPVLAAQCPNEPARMWLGCWQGGVGQGRVGGMAAARQLRPASGGDPLALAPHRWQGGALGGVVGSRLPCRAWKPAAACRRR